MTSLRDLCLILKSRFALAVVEHKIKKVESLIIEFCCLLSNLKSSFQLKVFFKLVFYGIVRATEVADGRSARNRCAKERPQRKHEFSRIRCTIIIGLTLSRVLRMWFLRPEIFLHSCRTYYLLF